MKENDEYCSEAELGEAIRRGDGRAEEVFFDRFAPVVMRRLRRDLGGSEEHEHADLADLLSRVMYNVAKQLKEHGVSNLTSYVLTATDHEIRSWARRRKREPEVLELTERDREAGPRRQSEASPDEDDPDTLSGDPEVVAIFREAFGRLGKRRQEVLLLRMRGFEFPEINRIMTDPGNTVTDNAINRLYTRAEDELTNHALELAAGRPELVQAIEREQTRRLAARKKSTRKTTTKKEGRA